VSGVSLCAGRTARRAAANAGARAAQAHSFFSSSISISFCLPVDGLAMLSCRAQAPRQAGAWGRRAADEAVRRTFMAQGLGALRLPTGLGSSPCPWNVHTCGVQCSYTTAFPADGEWSYCRPDGDRRFFPVSMECAQGSHTTGNSSQLVSGASSDKTCLHKKTRSSKWLPALSKRACRSTRVRVDSAPLPKRASC
jgi:hypothetical protein